MERNEFAIAKDGKVFSSFGVRRYRTGSVSGLDLTNHLEIDGDVAGLATFPQGWGAFVEATIEPGHARDVRCRGYHKCVYITLELQEGQYIIPAVFGPASVGYYGVLQDSVGAFVKGYGKRFSVAALPDVVENTGKYVAEIILN